MGCNISTMLRGSWKRLEKEMIKAHARLNDYVSRGIVPQDLKRTAKF
jgi:hypothetical protein